MTTLSNSPSSASTDRAAAVLDEARSPQSPITSNPTASLPTVELDPSFVLPTGLAAFAIPLLGLSLWAGATLALFAAFLMFQAVTLRLLFTDSALDIYRGETLIRRFPYQEWQNWAIFWDYVPTLFYFKEVRSIHFLPVLFDPKTLKACLEERCPPPVKAWQ